MAYDYKKWKLRMSERQDLSSSLVHLTRPAELEGNKFSAVDVLLKILRDKKIIGSTAEKGFIRGNRTAVCFQDALLYSIAQNLKFEKELTEANGGRHRYSGCGLVFSKYYLYQNKCRPVIYDSVEEGKKYLKESELFRLVAFDLTNTKNIIDWSHEREWRLAGNFDFKIEWSAVLLETKDDYREFVRKCMLPENEGILEKVCGIIVLDALLM
ncbi:hypothetical protein [Undibacterium sp. WLHG33]|uniref:hypothetical protein n=1 Tax=Undibacterium sp. WLHG33 TaxID=3412482 RepID=UPI003C2B096B